MLRNEENRAHAPHLWWTQILLVQTSMQIYTAVILGMLKLEPCVQA